MGGGGDLRDALGPAAVGGEEFEVAGDVAAVGLDSINGRTFQRLLMRQPLRQGGPEGGAQERIAQPSHRRIVRSKIPAKNARRSVPCVDLNWFGSSEAKTSIPGNLFGPRSSFIRASDWKSSAREP